MEEKKAFGTKVKETAGKVKTGVKKHWKKALIVGGSALGAIAAFKLGQATSSSQASDNWDETDDFSDLAFDPELESEKSTDEVATEE